MSKVFGSSKFWAAIILIIALAVGGHSLYRSRSTSLLDKTIYNEFRTAVNDIASSEQGGFTSQDELKAFITDWADSKELKYKEDKSGNIIFDQKAVKRKKNNAPTLICVNMNYETAADNAGLLASAAAVAYADLDSSRKTVVFVNDEQGLAKGYKGLSTKYLTSKSKVIYLDAGSSTYLSTGSFQERFSSISIDAKREDNVCDTAVKISIRGIKPGVIGPSISKQPDPISAFGTLLTRLKSRSAIYRIANLEVGTDGNMYPVSVDAVITLNSYAVSSFTSYIDKHIKSWEKTYGDDNEGLEYTYEVIDDAEELPKKTYTAATTDKLAGILYTVKSGAYRYSESDAIPEGKDAGDIYAINCLLGIDAENDRISINMVTQGYNDSFTERVIYDNSAAAELYNCSFSQGTVIDAFSNDRDSLSLTFQKTYYNIYKDLSPGSDITIDTDNFFTPCSYLANRAPKADIIHIRMNSTTASKIANTILCYIKTKGNTSFF
ncbi:MAG: hypothetical protein IJH92_00520 [Mogibacterium sp.]|nr:hypothetical protein [Mogibacterium sp.]